MPLQPALGRRCNACASVPPPVRTRDLADALPSSRGCASVEQSVRTC